MITKVFPILAVAVFSSTLGMGIVSPLLPLYVEDMGATGIWLGIIIAAYSFSHSIISPIAGRISDRFGRKPFLGTGLLVSCVVSLGYIWSGNVYQLASVRLINGVGSAMVLPIALAYVGDLSSEGEEGKWMGYAQTAFFSGFGLGPFIGGLLTEYFGTAASFSTMGGLHLLAFVVTLFFLPGVRHKKMATSSHLSFKEIGASGIVKGIFSFRLTESIGRGAIMTFLPIFAAMIGLSVTLIGVLLAFSILTSSILLPLGGVIADRFNRRFLIVLGKSIFIVAMVVIPMTNSFEQLFLALLIQGIGGAICIPASSALLVGEGRKYGMGSTMSTFFIAIGIGMATGPLLGGVVADFYSVDSVFYTAAGIGVIGTGLFIWFSR